MVFPRLKAYLQPTALRQLWHRLQHSSTKTLVLLFALGFCLSLVISACSPSPTNIAAPPNTTNPTVSASASPTISATVVRVGFQKAATILFSLKGKGSLEKALQPSGGSVTWTEFPAGPPLLEALNAGSIDFGFTGESPPVFAQAAGVPVRYVAYDPYGVKSEAIVVHKDSPIKTVADLKGKKIAVAKGSNTHYLAVSALASAGLTPNDVEFAFVKPSDGRAAFENKNVDAWSIWDPYLAAVEESVGARILVDAKGLAPNRGYYLASQSFVEKNPEVLKLVLGEIKEESDWAKSNPTEVAKFLSPALGINAAVLEKAERRREYDLLPLSDEVITKQQEIADTFAKLKLIPKSIKVKEAVWQEK